MQRFDAIIIGAGQAGPPLAGRLTGAGKSVCLVERKYFGGTCVNTGCMPTKALVASAYAAHLARRGADFGVGTGDITIDMKRVAARAHKVTMDSRASVETWLRGMKGCTVMTGQARFESADRLRVGPENATETITAPWIFLNVGGRAGVPDLPGLADVPYLTNSDIVGLDRVPDHLVVLGGSYIGLEFAQMYRRFGARVTVIEQGPRLISREDEDISQAIREILEAEGIEVVTGLKAESVAPDKNGIVLRLTGRDIRGSDLLLAVGRTPNTADLGLEAAGVKTDPRGYIEVGEDLQSSVKGIWAIGDCNGRGAFTHTAYNDFEIVAANLLDGEARRVSDRILGYGLFIDPPLGRVGMTQAQAEKTGRKLLVATRPMTRVGRAIEKGETKGFMKVVADAETQRILGAAILGTGGDEAIHAILTLMNADQPWTTLSWAVPIHPTVSELLPTLVDSMKPL
jgi:pyruvate/2-oxoglutarate dehydrogenase complex dihydrolipoamide dehydrogenase (E3) component